MQWPDLEPQAVEGCSLVVNRKTLEQRLQKILDTPEKPAEYAVMHLKITGNADLESETHAAKAFLGMLTKDLIWASAIDDCIASIGHSEFVLLMTFCPVLHALQIARLLRLWFRTRITPLNQCGNPPDLNIGIAPTLSDCAPPKILACAKSACESAKRRGRSAICIHRVETATRTACIDRKESADQNSTSGAGESRPGLC